MQKKHLNIFWGIHCMICLIYALPIAYRHPFLFITYCTISFVIFSFVLRSLKIKRKSYLPKTNISVQYLRGVLLVALLFIFVNYENLSMPNLFLSSYVEKIESKGFFPSFINSFVLMASFMLGSISGSKGDKFLISLTICFLYLASGSTSRGGLLIFLIPIILLWREYKFIKVLSVTIPIGLIVLFVSVVMSRIGLEKFDIFQILAAEMQYENTGFLIFSQDGNQPLKRNLFFFFLPSFIKGEWIATNHFISEQILGLSMQSSLFYVITLGDFANFLLGYGYFWFVYAVFGIISSLLIIKLVMHLTPKFGLYYLFIYLLIGSRVGTESLLPILLWAYLVPLVLHIILLRCLKFIFNTRMHYGKKIIL